MEDKLMNRPMLSAKHRRRVSFTLLILGMPLIMGQLEDCLPGLDPKFNAEPLALDCVSNGTQIYMPIDMSATLARAPIALTGTPVETMVTAEIPPAMFCALADAQATQTDIDSAAIGINIDGTMPPGDTFALHTAVNLPIQNIDIAAACAGAGPAIVVDFGMVQTAPWADGHTMDFTVAPPPAVLIGLRNIDLPGLPIPGPTVDLVGFCDPTDKSQPPNGTTDDPEDSPRIAADRDGDGDYESLATAFDQVMFDIQGWCRSYRCDDGNDCTIDHCNRLAQGWCTWDSEPNGTACDFNGEPGQCDGVGNCGAYVDPAAPCDPLQSSCTKTITLGCTNNITADVIMQTFELTVTPDPLIGDTVVPVNYSGVVVFPEFFMDSAQGGPPGGVTHADLVAAQATVHVRSGATASDATLTATPIPGTCLIGQTSCDSANDGPSVPGLVSNTDCVPVGRFNPCQHRVAFPTSSDCGVAGTCAFLGKSHQCDINGFCITGPLLIPLEDAGTTITPDASGEVLFGWDDQSTGAALNPDGTWDLPPPIYLDPTGPNGIRINQSGLAIGIECTMGVDSGGPFGPVPPVPDQSSPTPDSHLINFPIQTP
jgi:hypothetical protein